MAETIDNSIQYRLARSHVDELLAESETELGETDVLDQLAERQYEGWWRRGR